MSPEDDVEIRRVTLTNRSLRTRRLECSSYVELSMAPHAADRQHPAFNKLFIQTEALRQQRALLAFRRPGGRDAPPMYVAHRVTLEEPSQEPLRFETDRRVFIGRGRTPANPAGSFEEPHNTEGCVLDPILSIRTSVTLAPGRHVVLTLVVGRRGEPGTRGAAHGQVRRSPRHPSRHGLCVGRRAAGAARPAHPAR